MLTVDPVLTASVCIEAMRKEDLFPVIMVPEKFSRNPTMQQVLPANVLKRDCVLYLK